MSVYQIKMSIELFPIKKSQFLIILSSKNQYPTTGEISVTVGRISGMEARP